MKQIGLDTAVYCENEFCGVIHYLIIRPTSWLLTHIVVKPAKLPGIVNRDDRLVSTSKISKISDGSIWLECSVEKFANLLPFTKTFFVEVPASGYSFTEDDMVPSLSSTQTWMYVPVTKYNIPHGEVVLSYQVQVEAKNGHLGQFKAISIDPTVIKSPS